MNFNVLDLFSGAGGMAEGFIQAGFRVPFASDHSKEAAATYKNRHAQLGYNLNYYEGDVKDLTKRKFLCDFLNNSKIDVVVGGPPCQGFSLVGRRAEDDFRNVLFLDFLKVVKLVQPSYFVMENVEGILTYEFKKIKGISGREYENISAPEVIVKEAKYFGYAVKYQLLNAKDYGVPQNRPRVIFLGYRACFRGAKVLNLVTIPEFPEKRNSIVTIEEAISDIRFLKSGQTSEKYDNRFKLSEYQKSLRNGLTPDVNGDFIPAATLYNHKASVHREKTTDRFKLLKPGEDIDSLLNRLDQEQYKIYVTKKYRCRKLAPNSVSPTVLTLPDDIVHYDLNNPRILTVRELARIQSFDDSFEFLGKRTTGGNRRKFEVPQYTQVGNAVPPLFACAIAGKIMVALKCMLNESEILNINKS
ncbi:DNA cytosine methyltransferase [Anaerosinus sp.]